MRTARRTPRLFWTGLVSAALLLGSCAPAAAPSPAAAPAPASRATPVAAAPAAAPAQPAAPPAPAARATPIPQPTPTATPVGSQVKKGGILRSVIWADPGNLDLLGAASMISLAPQGLHYDGLVKEDPFRPGQVLPDLAERWEVSGDGTKVTFTLRKGITFHNGRPLTSADAKHSVQRWMKDTELLVSTFSAMVKSVEAPDVSTLVINLNLPTPDLFKILILDWASVAPADQPTGRNLKEIVGTGPFKFKGYQSGVAWETVRNEKYWNKGLPHLDGVTVYIIPDRNTGLAAFRAGRLDVTAPVYLTVPQHKVIETQMKGAATAHLFPNSYSWNLYMPAKKNPWTDARVRKAAFLAIDRKQAVSTVDKGLGTADGVVPPSMGGPTPEELAKTPGWREPKSADIDEARRLMAEAGVSKGLKIDILYRPGGDYEAMATFIKDQLGKIGIESTISTGPASTFLEYLDARNYQTLINRPSLTPAIIDTILVQNYRSGNSRNFGDVSDAKLDQMIDRQMSTLDLVERKKQVRAIETYLHENALATIISWGSYSQAWQKWVRDFVPGETTSGNIRMETVWLDK